MGFTLVTNMDLFSLDNIIISNTRTEPFPVFQL